MIERALSRTNQNQSEASKLLGVHRNTLLRKMVEYEIDGKRLRRKPRRARAKRVLARASGHLRSGWDAHRFAPRSRARRKRDARGNGPRSAGSRISLLLCRQRGARPDPP